MNKSLQLAMLSALAFASGCQQPRGEAVAPTVKHIAVNSINPTHGPVPVVMNTTHEAENRLIESLLAGATLKVSGQPLIRVIDAIEQIDPRLKVFVNWSALEGGGIEKGPLIDRPLLSGSADKVLAAALKQASDELGKDDPFAYAVIDGIVHISTASDLSRHVETRIYILPAAGLHPQWRLRRAGYTLFMESDEAEADYLNEADREQFMETLTTLIQDVAGNPHDWEAYGGEYARIRPVHGALFIRATRATHKEVHTLLTQVFAGPGFARRWLPDDEVEAILARAEGLREKQDHTGAMRLVDSALFVAPDHARARAMKLALEGTIKR